jgi:drug/metabolite transporter (DMT)-like permease
MSAPLLIVALSRPLLHEPLSLRRGFAVALGMLGVLIALQPSAAGLSLWGGLAALGAACGYALTSILIRIQMRTETGWATVFWGLLLQTLISGVFVVDEWVALRWADWPLIVVLGFTGALGQHWITKAFYLAPAQLLAPLEYCALLWGIAFDAILWGQWPQLHVSVGAVVVIASGVYVLNNARRG